MEDASFEERRISLEDLQSMANDELEGVLWPTPDAIPPSPGGADNAWVRFEAEVRKANASAQSKMRQHAGERSLELLRLLEIEELTRCQAFQAALMGEVPPVVYSRTVRSILEKLLGKLECFSAEPALYQSAAQCLSEYMSALNHHSDICAVPKGAATLPSIEEGRDYGDHSASDLYSERSEDTDTLSVHSEQMITGEQSSMSVDGFGFNPSLGMGGSMAGGMAGRRPRRPRRRRPRHLIPPHLAVTRASLPRHW